MEWEGKTNGWVCIFSTLFMGCYSSALIDPVGPNRPEIYSGRVEYVVTKDRKRYDFDDPPVVQKERIVGSAVIVVPEVKNRAEVSIALTDIAQLGQSESGIIRYVVTKSGTKYAFTKPAIIVDKKVIGEADNTPPKPLQQERVSNPLSDVREICVSESQPFATLGFGLGVGVGVYGLILVVSLIVGVDPF